jgi:hypothetical protein
MVIKLTTRGFWMLSLVGAVLCTTRSAAAFSITWNSTWYWHTQTACPSGSTCANQVTDLDYAPTCLDGSGTGIGVYAPTTWNGKIMYWFDGGGYCFDKTTCNTNVAPSSTTWAADVALIAFGSPPTPPPAPFVVRTNFPYSSFNTYLTADGSDDINGMYEYKPSLGQGIFDHTGTINPFTEYLQVFVPYCTGDLHIGDRDDTASSFRTPSNRNFTGFSNATQAVTYTDKSVRSYGFSPTMSVVTGGSAGGFGALLLYGAFRQILPSSETMITISDGGTPYFTGTPNSNGKTWASQGYLGFPTGPRTGCPECVSPTTVSYQEAYMADAWGLTWMQDYNSSFVSQATPAGSPGPLVSMQEVLSDEVFHNTVGDSFHVFDGNDDYVDTWFLSMYFNTSSSVTVADGQAQILSKFGGCTLGTPPAVNCTTISGASGPTLMQITATTSGYYSGALKWNEHHGFLTNDTSTWDDTKTTGGQSGSGVLQFLGAIAPSGGW